MFKKIVYNFVKDKLKQEIIDDLKVVLVKEITNTLREEILAEINEKKTFMLDLKTHLKGKNVKLAKDMDVWQLMRTQNVTKFDLDVTYIYKDGSGGEFNFKTDSIHKFKDFVKETFNELHPYTIDKNIESITAITFRVWYSPVRGINKTTLTSEYFLGVNNDKLYNLYSYDNTMKIIEKFFDEEPQLFL